MIGYMCEAVAKAHTSLPYGMVLTLILKEFGIPISDQEPKWLLCHTDHYNLQTLHRMGYKKENDKWVKKGEIRQTKGVDSIISESPPTRLISPPQPQEPSTSVDAIQLSDDQLRKIACLVVEKLRG